MSDHPALAEITPETKVDAALLRRMARQKVPLDELVAALESAEHEVSLCDYLDNGYSSKDFAKSEITLHELWTEINQFTASGQPADVQRRDAFLLSLAKAGWSASEAIEEGLQVADLARAGYDARKCWTASQGGGFLEAFARVRTAQKGFNADHWKSWSLLEPTVKECRKAGIPAASLEPRTAAIKVNQLLDVGYTAADVFACGYPASEALSHLSVAKCYAAGYSAKQLHDAGKSKEELAKADVPPNVVLSEYVTRDANGFVDPAEGRKFLEKLAKSYPIGHRGKVERLAQQWSRAEQAGTTFEEVETAWIDLQKLAAKRYRMEVAQKRWSKAVDDETLAQAIIERRLDITNLQMQLMSTVDAGQRKKIEDEIAHHQHYLQTAEDLDGELKVAKREYETKRDEFLKIVKQRRKWIQRQMQLESSATAQSRSLKMLQEYDQAATAAAMTINDALAQRFYSYAADKPGDYAQKTAAWREKIFGLCVFDQGGNLFARFDGLHQELGSPGTLPEFPAQPEAPADSAYAADVAIPYDFRSLNARLSAWHNLEHEFEVENQLLDLLVTSEKRAHKAYGGVVPMKRWFAVLQLLADSITTASLAPALLRDGIKSVAKQSLEIEPLKKSNSTGSRTFAMNLGFSYGEIGKLTAGIAVSGALRIDDDRRLRANLTITLSIGAEVTPPSAKFIKLSITAGLSVFNRTWAFADEKHFAYYLALHLSRIKAARELFDEMPDPRVMLRSQRYADLVYDTFTEVIGGDSDKVRSEALAYLAHRPVIRVGAAGTYSVEGGFSEDLTGIEATGAYSYSPKSFSKLHTFLSKGSRSSYVEEYKKGYVRTIGPFNVSGTFYVNASVSFTYAHIENDANPDNDGKYLTLTVPGTKYLPGGVSISAPSPPSDYSNHAIAQFKDEVKFAGWNSIVQDMAPGVSSVGIDASHSVNGVINWVYPPTHKNYPVIQYMRMEESSNLGFDIGFEVETGYGEVGIDVGASLGHTVAMSERLGDNTLTYVTTVFNGLIPRHNGHEQWQKWMADHKSGFFRIIKRIGKEGSNIRLETQSMQDGVNGATDVWKDQGGKKTEVRFLENVVGDDGTRYGYGEVHRLEPATAESFVKQHVAAIVEGSARGLAQKGPDPIDVIDHCTKARKSWAKKRFKEVRGSKEYKDGLELLTTLFARALVVGQTQGQYTWRRRRVALTPATGALRASCALNRTDDKWFLVKAPLISGFSVVDVWSNEGFVSKDPDADGRKRYTLRTYYDTGIVITLSLRSHRREKFCYRGKVEMELHRGHGWDDLQARMRNLVSFVAKDPQSLSGIRVRLLKGNNRKPYHRALQLDILMRLHPELSTRFHPFREEFDKWVHRMKEKHWYERVPAKDRDELADTLLTKADEALKGFEKWCHDNGIEDPMSAILQNIEVPVPAFRHDKAFWEKGPLDRTKPNDSIRYADVQELMVRRVSDDVGQATPNAKRT